MKVCPTRYVDEFELGHSLDNLTSEGHRKIGVVWSAAESVSGFFYTLPPLSIVSSDKATHFLHRNKKLLILSSDHVDVRPPNYFNLLEMTGESNQTKSPDNPHANMTHPLSYVDANVFLSSSKFESLVYAQGLPLAWVPN